MPEGYENRLVLDEDVPPSLAEALRQRGFDAAALNELRGLIYERSSRQGGSIGDDEVCDEVSRVPSVLITLNVRDYADLAGLEQLVLARGVSVAMVRVPKGESRAGQRAKAIADIVHRHAHRIVRLHGDVPRVASVTRRGLRVRSLEDIPTLRGGDEQGIDR